jgi:formylglycine-generating enzyme required for sulfatase activity
MTRTASRRSGALASLRRAALLALPLALGAGAVAAPRARVEAQAEPRGDVGTLAFFSRVSRVEIFVDDQRIGVTRGGSVLVVPNIPAGARRIVARRDGYRPWERTVEVVAGARHEVRIDLEPLGAGATPRVFRGDDGAEMMLVAAGEFWMGIDDADQTRLKDECRQQGGQEADCVFDREGPRHRVWLDAYYLDRYEVTNALFERFVRATAYRTTAEREGHGWSRQYRDERWQWIKLDGAYFRQPGGSGTASEPSHPVVMVSWNDADTYCRLAGKRLPTEAEWEKAARGTDGRRYPWGDAWDAARANAEMKVGSTSPVGRFPSGASPYDIHDLAGNVFEWVADWHDDTYYRRSPERNPRGPETGTEKGLRGGAWTKLAIFVRATFREASVPTDRNDLIGFRCAKSAG